MNCTRIISAIFFGLQLAVLGCAVSSNNEIRLVIQPISVEKIAEQRLVYSDLLRRHAQTKKITMVASGIFALSVISFMAYELYKPVVTKKNGDLDEGQISFDDAISRARLEAFLKKDDTLPFVELLKKYFKQGCAYAVCSVSAMFCMNLFTNAHKTFNFLALRQLLYKTDLEGFEEVVFGAHKQTLTLMDLCKTMRKECVALPFVDSQDYEDFKETYLVSMVEIINLLIDSFEHLTAYVAACVDVLAPDEFAVKNELVAQCLQPFMLDMHTIIQVGNKMIATSDEQEFVRSCITVERRTKQINVRLERAMLLLSERLYGQNVKS